MQPASTRTTWKGAISFGLVHIPIALHSATVESRPKFNLLDQESGSKIGYQQVSKSTGQAVDQSQMVKGVQVGEGQYVALTREEIRQALPRATQLIEIEAFVPGSAIDPMYFNKPYHVAPAARGQKAYNLLRDTLKKTEMVGIARVVISTKQHMAALRPMGKGLVLNLLRWADEIREQPAFPEAETPPTAKEVQMAEMLVNDMAAAWSPDMWHDDFKAALEQLVDLKAKKGDIMQVKVPGQEIAPTGAEVIDLTDLLKRSLGRSSAEPVKSGKVAKTAKPAANDAQRRAAAAAKAPTKSRASVTPLRKKSA